MAFFKVAAAAFAAAVAVAPAVLRYYIAFPKKHAFAVRRRRGRGGRKEGRGERKERLFATGFLPGRHPLQYSTNATNAPLGTTKPTLRLRLMSVKKAIFIFLSLAAPVVIVLPVCTTTVVQEGL